MVRVSGKSVPAAGIDDDDDIYIYNGLLGRVFTNCLGDWDSISGLGSSYAKDSKNSSWCCFAYYSAL